MKVILIKMAHCTALVESFYEHYAFLKPKVSLKIHQQIKKTDPDYIFICKQGKLTIVQQKTANSTINMHSQYKVFDGLIAVTFKHCTNNGWQFNAIVPPSTFFY